MNKNILANIVGKFWTTISNFLFIPIYIQILGIDNYSVISFSLIVVGMLALLDAGLSQTISREMARGDIDSHKKYRAFATLEKIYFIIFLTCSALGLLFSGPVVEYFINDTPVNHDVIILCLKIIASEAGLQIFFRFYVSAMMGLERQVEANLLNMGWGVVRNGLVIVVLLIVPTLTGFFVWQFISTFALLLAAKWGVRRMLAPWRPDTVAFIDWDALRRVRAFALGIFLISLVAVVNYNADRLMLSHLFSLEYLGYYSIAVSIGTGMLAISSPFLASVQPRLTKQFSEGAVVDATRLYLRVTTLVAILVFPLTATIGFNAETVILAWTGNPRIAARSAEIVPWAVAAYAMLSVSSLAFGVALSNGYTRYNNIMGVLVLIISIPGYWFAVTRHGAVGAAIFFFLVQLLSAILLQVLVDRRFLRIGALRGLMQLYLCPAVAGIVLAWIFCWVVAAPVQSRLLMLVYLGVAYAFALAGTGLMASAVFGVRWRSSGLKPS